MADRDIEHDAVDKLPSSDLSSESSESIESIDESTALFHNGSSSTNYKSTSIVKTASEDSGSISDLPTSKSVSAIISLLLIGKVICPKSDSEEYANPSIVGTFISCADATLVLSTYTTIASEFSELGNASWLTTSFTLALCAVQPITGNLSDIYGRKGVLLVSYALFGVGSAVW